MCQGKCQGPLLVIHGRDFAFNAFAPLVTFVGPTQAGWQGGSGSLCPTGHLCLLRKHQEPTHLKIML